MRNLYKELDKYLYHDIEVLKQEINCSFAGWFLYLWNDLLQKIADSFLMKYPNKINSNIWTEKAWDFKKHYIEIPDEHDDD